MEGSVCAFWQGCWQLIPIEWEFVLLCDSSSHLGVWLCLCNSSGPTYSQGAKTSVTHCLAQGQGRKIHTLGVAPTEELEAATMMIAYPIFLLLPEFSTSKLKAHWDPKLYLE